MVIQVDIEMTDDEMDVNSLTVLNLETVEVEDDDTVVIVVVIVVELVE